MDWIKRNLYFFVGSIVAVVLMGLAGFYLYSKWQLNNEAMEKLNQDYAELQRLNQENPHPGAGQVDNIQAAKEQQQQMRDAGVKVRRHFERVPAIPDLGTNVTSQEFKSGLDRTVAQLQREATNQSVNLQPDYGFSFTAQRPLVKFAEGSLEPLSIQLGEVKALCDVLFAAKINWLDNIRRQRVSADDSTGPQTDYVLTPPVTNELAVLAPYELTFRCFSEELALVLEGFGSSPHGLLVKDLNVEPAAASLSPDLMTGALPYAVTPTPMPVTPTTPRFALPRAEGADAAAAFAQRYGIGPRGGPEAPGGLGGASRGGIQYRPLTPGATTPTTPTYSPGTTPTAPAKGGLPTVLDQKLLKITMTVNVVKLLPSK